MTNISSNSSLIRGRGLIGLVVGVVLALGVAGSSGPAQVLEGSRASVINTPSRVVARVVAVSKPRVVPIVADRSTAVSAPLPAPTAIAASFVIPAAGDELLHSVPTPTVSHTSLNAPVRSPAASMHKKPRMLWMEVTAYCACKKCCGSHAQGLTASGKRITYNDGHFVAADVKLLPFGTKLIVPGYNEGKAIEVIDRGGAIKGHHIDLFMPSHQQAMEWGKQWIQVTVAQ
ncbi:MAG TPA: 3D domain-containing protein [Tepidisphaeraceae bacterium]|nr:3D domain-containing protein [Tepidisphaeraceae bacterium]